MRADRRERLDGAFEGIEDERAAAHGHLEALVIIVSALRAFTHGDVLLLTVKAVDENKKRTSLLLGGLLPLKLTASSGGFADEKRDYRAFGAFV
jgi:hypothetical protein